MTIIAYWSGTAAEFRKLSFTQWLVQACANAAIINAAKPVWRKLEVKHL